MTIEPPDSTAVPNEPGGNDHDDHHDTADSARIKPILEAALLAAGRPLALNDLEQLFAGDLDAPPRSAVRAALAELDQDWQGRCLALQEVASGFRAQVRQEFEPWLARLWDEKPPRYSRALLETLAIVAYRQPITRSEIEDIRGVSVSTQIMRTLTEREWVRVVGHRDAPGRPAMYGTTRQFLDHFNLKSLDQLPELSELDQLGNHPELEFDQAPGAEAADPTVVATAAAASDEGGDGHEAAGHEEAGHEEAGHEEAAAHTVGGEDGTESMAANAAASEPSLGAQHPAVARQSDPESNATEQPAADTEDPSCTSAW